MNSNITIITSKEVMLVSQRLSSVLVQSQEQDAVTREHVSGSDGKNDQTANINDCSNQAPTHT